jgi:tRNA nucleotidyltransferase (CCA-adding enzyme)
MNIKINPMANLIIQILYDYSFKAYIVGGVVRDCILGRNPNDWDICTNAKPEDIICIMKQKGFTVIPTGLKHGTITIVVPNTKECFEITTFRDDGKYSDNRRPDEVKFTNSLIEDLSRRDFTMNAIAYNDEEGLIDPFGGLYDINDKIIRCVGLAEERFNEDSLRMMRAIRFKAQLGFDLDKYTWKAIHNNYKLIENISMERIQQELNKILLSNPLEIYTLNHFKLLNHISPEFDACFWTNQDNPYHIYSVGKHITHSCGNIETILHLRLTMLLHDIGKPQCKTIDENGRGHFYGHPEISSQLAIDILKKLRYDNYTIMKVRDLVLYHNDDIPDTKKGVRRWLNKIGEEMLKDLLKVKIADAKAQNLEYSLKKIEKTKRIEIILEEILEDKNCFSRKDLAISGSDLIKMGYPQSKDIGEIIDFLLNKVIDNPELNTKEKLTTIVKEEYVHHYYHKFKKLFELS